MNLGKWKGVAQRLARMDRDELRFRAGQELAKRQDALLYLMRFDPSKNALDKNALQSARGNFFFGPGDVEGRLELLRQRLPEQVQRIVQQADRILEHRFDLLGYTDLAYGGPIDWHLDLVHGKRSPRRMFHRVRYLDFDQVGDSKITWELNRHQHFVTLAKAYRLTADLRYADEILRQWRHWRAENPYPRGINWSSSLEVAFRSVAWLWTYYVLSGAPSLPDFREEWLRGLALHGRHIERYLSTYFSPNTHLLGEGVALFFLGVLCPEIKTAHRWKTLGWQIILDEACRQVRPDGFYFEQSTYYHVYALDLFLHAAILASVNGIPLPREFEETLEKMLIALYLLGRSGAPPRFGDDDGGRLFDPRRNASEHLLDPLATGAILFNRSDYKAVAQLCEETIWLLGPEGVQRWDEIESVRPTTNSAALESSGMYLMTSEKPFAQLVVDCGSLGVQSGGHGHADALSVTLRSRKHDLLIDPGTFEYAGEGGERNLFRGTAMHNTLRVDGADQAEIGGLFSWDRLTQTKVERWVQGKSFDLLSATHDGYQRLASPVKHRRMVLSLRNGIYLVRDEVVRDEAVRDEAEGSGQHQLEISWHLSQELQMVEDGLFRVKGASEGLALLAVAGHAWAQEVSKQSWSPVYGRKAPMMVVTFSKTNEIPSDFCVLLVALEEALTRPGTFEQIGDNAGEAGVSGYRYVSNGEEYCFFFCSSGKAWRQDAVSSDAGFVCWSRLPSGATDRLIVVNGSYAEIESGPALRFTRGASWGELNAKESRYEIFSSDPNAVDETPIIGLPDAPVSIKQS